MGEADDDYTSARRAVFKRMAEDSAKVGKKLARPERTAFKKMAEDSAKFAKKLAEAERAAAKKATEVAPKPKSKKKQRRKSYWDDAVGRVLKEKFPDNRATNFKSKDVLKTVLAALTREIRMSGKKAPSRGLILRKSGHWKS